MVAATCSLRVRERGVLLASGSPEKLPARLRCLLWNASSMAGGVEHSFIKHAAQLKQSAPRTRDHNRAGDRDRGKHMHARCLIAQLHKVLAQDIHQFKALC